MSNRKRVEVNSDEEPGGSPLLVQKENWQVSYKNSFNTITSLTKHLYFRNEELNTLKKIAKIYHLRVPSYYLSLVKDPYDFEDPVRKQSIPSVEEINEEAQENIDPLGEEKTSPVSCLVHRYPDRVLLLVTGRCFMYCRHCTRKRLWQSKISDPTLRDIDKALSYVKANRQIREVVVSGGDPLTLPTERLEYILNSVSSCRNVEVIRIGTRAPVVLPQRVDSNLCKLLEKYKNLWINVQFNHPVEIASESEEACRKLQRCGIPVNNQSVLLKGINDDPQIMTELCHKLQQIRVRPYYLFECDPVKGATHFRTPVKKGIEIISKMRGFTSGMCIPNFVVDGIDGKGKVVLGPDNLVSYAENEVILRNYEGKEFSYHNPRDI